LSLTDGSDSRSIPGHDPATGRFQKGFRGAYRTRQEAIKQRIDALLTAYNAITPADLALLGAAATHLEDAAKARSRVNRVRATNAAVRILREIPRRPEHVPTMDEVLNGTS
jgi:hypothetical protein